MSKRSSLPPAPNAGVPASPKGAPPMRRAGVRREVTERVLLVDGNGKNLEGWALNVSRGGLRAVLEDQVELGQKLHVTVGTDEVLERNGRVVWIQEEPDGVIVGIEFLADAP